MMRIFFGLVVFIAFQSFAHAQSEVFWDSTDTVSTEDLPGELVPNFTGGSVFESLGSNSTFFDHRRLVTTITVAAKVTEEPSGYSHWLAEFDPATVINYRYDEHAMAGLGNYDLVSKERVIDDVAVIPVGGGRYDFVLGDINRELLPFEVYNVILTHSDGSAFLTRLLSTESGSCPLGSLGSNGVFFNGETKFLSEFPLTNQAIAWKVEGILLADLGDINRDGAVNLLDVAPFVDLLTTGGLQIEADINQDGVVDLLDVAPFVDLLSGP